MTNLNWIAKSCSQGISVELMNICKQSITFAAATTGAIAAKELFTVQGEVMMSVIGVVTTDLTGTGSIQLGIAGATDAFLGATVGTALDTGEIFGVNTTPPTSFVTTDALPAWIYSNELDAGYEVSVGTITAGVIDFYCRWYPLTEGSTVVPAGSNASIA